MSATAFATLREEIDWLLSQQTNLLRLGVTAARLSEASDVLLWLAAKTGHEGDPVEVVEELTVLLIDVLWSLGDHSNPRARGARLLYGSDPRSMGLPLKSRRFLAAQEIVVQRADGEMAIATDSFSRLWVPGIAADVSWGLALWASRDRQSRRKLRSG